MSVKFPSLQALVSGPRRFLSHPLHSYPIQGAAFVKAGAQDRIARIDSERPFSPALVDSFQRKHDYLRISLTERCNLRCFYCMPSEGVRLSLPNHILTDDEVVRLASLFVRCGVRKIRLTGGEPTVRKGLATLIRRLDALRPLGLESIGITSNGLALHRQLPNLVGAGLTHLNLSLDTLDPFKFEIMTRRLGHDAVLKSLDVALSCSSLKAVKLNVVVIKGLNDSEIIDFVNLTKDKEIWVRFIEFMPFMGNKWDKAKMVPSAELLALIKKEYPTIERVETELSDTARSWKIPEYSGGVGFISSMSDQFCSSCNRLRITADGQIKVCLFDPKEISLRDHMRRGAGDDELLQVIQSAVFGKKEKHAGMDNINTESNRPMILIGGAFAHDRRVLPPPLTHPFMRTRGSVAANPLTNVGFSRRWSTHSSNHEPRLTHLDAAGRPSMVEVGAKESTKRTATATGCIYIPKMAYNFVSRASGQDAVHWPAPWVEQAWEKARSKGDVLVVAQLAAIMGCKRTPELIPLCHPLQLSNVSVTLVPEAVPQEEQTPKSISRPSFRVRCSATVSCEGKTGVEMEALTAVSVGLLTVWDMLKAIAGKEMVIGDIVVTRKSGGKSGDFVRDEHRSCSG